MDLLIIHSGRMEKNRLSILHMPYGTILLCDFLSRHQIEARIFNAAAEIASGKEFSLIELVRKHNPKAIGLTLQWYSQMISVFDCSRRLKRIFPDKKIVVGGITASFFSKEILENEKSIDYVIRGDSEVPLLKLCQQIRSGNLDLKSIDNLSYRVGNKICENPIKYKISQKIFDSLSYAKFEYILNKDSVFNISNNFYAKLKKGRFYFPDSRKKIFFYITSRGCFFNCAYCSASNYHKLCTRTAPVYKSPETVVTDIKKILQQGIDTIYFPTFPDAFKEDNYYTRLFQILRRENISFNCIIEPFHLPSQSFLDIFYKTFKNNIKDSQIILSPDLLDEKKRGLIKNQYYSNRDLLSFIYVAKKYGINVKIFIAAGLPFTSRLDYNKDLLYAIKLSHFDNLEIVMNTAPIEPYSPMFLNPRKYNISLKCKNFKDFLVKKPGDPGYETDQLSAKEIFLIVSEFNKKMSRADKKFKKVAIKNIN